MADAVDPLARRLEQGGERLGAVGRDRQHHADPAIEAAQHLILGDAARAHGPAEHLRQWPGPEIDLGAQPRRQNAGQVLDQPATGDMRQRVDPARPDRVETGADIDPGRCQQGRAERALRERCARLPAEPFALGDAPHQREAVGMHTRGGEAEQHVALGHPRRQQRAALCGADGEAREVEVAGGIHAGHLRRFPTDECAASHATALGDTFDHLGRRVDRKPRAGEVVEEEQRLRPLTDQVVDAHRHEIDADPAEIPGVDRYAQLGAHPVGRGDQHRVGITRGRRVEQRGEAAEPGHAARAPGGRRGGPDPLDKRVARGDVHTRLGIGQSFGAVRRRTHPVLPRHL